jgi:hypothetical protein
MKRQAQQTFWDKIMPRLSHPKITKGHAVDALLNLYRNDREFAQELDEIRDPYLDLIIQCAIDFFDYGRKSRLSPKEYFEAVIEHATSGEGEHSFLPKTSIYAVQLRPYFLPSMVAQKPLSCNH